MTTIQMQGSKLDKVLQLFKAMRAVSSCAPWGGGLQGDLAKAHDLLRKEYIKAYMLCMWSEVEADRFCSQIVGE